MVYNYFERKTLEKTGINGMNEHCRPVQKLCQYNLYPLYIENSLLRLKTIYIPQVFIIIFFKLIKSELSDFAAKIELSKIILEHPLRISQKLNITYKIL